MENKPLISVIMGIYNCAETLEEAVDCIINQTFTDWELIMCDDCSKDNTYEVALKLAEKDSRIIVIKNEKNLTLAPTLNRCIDIAKGEYIARMDGDDVCDITRFEKELDFLKNNPQYAIVSSLMNLYDKYGVYRTIMYREKPLKESFIKGSQFCHAGCMMRTEAIKAVGGYSESMNYKRVEDFDLWVRMYKKGYIGYNIQEALYSMRDDRNAISRRTLESRKNEARVIKNAYKWFNLPKKYIIYVITPIIKWLVPNSLYKLLHKNGVNK